MTDAMYQDAAAEDDPFRVFCARCYAVLNDGTCDVEAWNMRHRVARWSLCDFCLAHVIDVIQKDISAGAAIAAALDARSRQRERPSRRDSREPAP